MVFYVVYKNHTEEEFVYPVESRLGMQLFSLLDKRYEEKGGLLTYKAEIRTRDGTVYREWKHQLWVKLIVLKE